MGALSTQSALLTAAMQLSVVRLLRGAIATTAAAAGGGGGARAPVDRFEPRPVIHPTPRFLPRPVVHPTPRFEPRPVIAPEPRYQNLANAPVEAQTPTSRLTAPLEPVWKKLPALPVPGTPHIIKHVHRPPDIIHKGSLIDFFI